LIKFKVKFKFLFFNLNKQLVFKLTATFPLTKDRSPDACVLEKDYGVLHHRVEVSLRALDILKTILKETFLPLYPDSLDAHNVFFKFR